MKFTNFTQYFIKFFKLAIILILFSTSLFPQENTSKKDAKSDEKSSANLQIHQLTSKVFGNTRSIRVLLPPGYHDAKNGGKHYPVLYITDGFIVFRRFNVEETVHRLINEGTVKPLIIVGIDNGTLTDKAKNSAFDHRANEFLPYPDVGFAPNRLYAPDPPNPIGKQYPDFVSEVISLVEQKYRIKSGANNTGIGGFSYGGVAALHTAMNRPRVFGILMLESTPLWIGKDKQLLKDTKLIKKWGIKVYIGLGAKESPDEVLIKEGRALQNELIDTIKRASPKTEIKFFFDGEGKHDASSWSKRFPAALQFLFNNRKNSQRIRSQPFGIIVM